ncbi:hypothetical protein [Rhodococcus erythropolis]|uniref:hypothetical protein n=1 Tax=Rhodococcus erythropolis TaxID=1833 RepID=UPI001BE79D21|nr:hypothetical protein [Rhodococcus erythropolis]MBT2263462.1 hypothetical protein [Rhodococcus erythropolis]
MDNEVEACSERVCDHVRRSLAGIGNLLMETGQNTLNEIDPFRDPNEHSGIKAHHQYRDSFAPETAMQYSISVAVDMVFTGTTTAPTA